MMSKRKHSDIDALELSNPSANRNIKRQRKDLAAAFEDGKKQLLRAFKMARGFERQKLGRRQKNNKEKKDGQDLERLQAEFEALKSLDLSAASDTYLCRQIVKIEPIAEHSALPDEVKSRASQPVSKNAAYANVTARLYNSRPVSEAVNQILGIMRRTLGLRESNAKPKKRMRKADYEAAAGSGSNKANTMTSGAPDASTAQLPEDGTGDEEDSGSFAGFSDDEDFQAHDAEAVFNSEDEDRMASDISPVYSRALGVSDEDENAALSKFDSQPGSSSEDKGEDGDLEAIKSMNHVSPKLKSQSLKSDHIPTSNDAGKDRSFVSPSPSPDIEPKRHRAKENGGGKATSSFFLPALATGYISGSESDASEVSAVGGPRKNRMGQRARQALWERQHGANANHLKKDGKKFQSRDEGWDARRGATSDQKQKPWERKQKNPNKDRFQSDKREKRQKPPEIAPPKIPTYGAAHPSWIAKQQAKERAASATRPAGKKITFD